jgi:hypothetical protein
VSAPQIILGGTEGFHNTEGRARPYRDLSTVCVVPTRGAIPARVVETWMGLMAPMNQKFARVFVCGLEVGDAYEQALEQILAHPDLSQWRYVLTLEEDNIPPPDGLLKLYDHFDDEPLRKGTTVAVGGLYWTKGEGGQPMCYGRPDQPTYQPFLPSSDGLHFCNGLGMGFTLFRLDALREMEKPRFKTLQQWDPQTGAKAMTQDLYAFEKLRQQGWRVACDASVRVGHLDAASGVVW